jgi:transcription elongation factor Elf1
MKYIGSFTCLVCKKKVDVALNGPGYKNKEPMAREGVAVCGNCGKKYRATFSGNQCTFVSPID